LAPADGRGAQTNESPKKFPHASGGRAFREREEIKDGGVAHAAGGGVQWASQIWGHVGVFLFQPRSQPSRAASAREGQGASQKTRVSGKVLPLSPALPLFATLRCSPPPKLGTNSDTHPSALPWTIGSMRAPHAGCTIRVPRRQHKPCSLEGFCPGSRAPPARPLFPRPRGARAFPGACGSC